MRSIQTLETAERPRERLGRYGAEHLSDEELLALLLGSGGAKAGVHALAKQVLRVVNEKNGELCVDDLKQLPGIGMAKASLVVSALEFARRRIRPRGVRIQEARDVLPLISHWARKQQEHFIAVTLNGAHEVIETRVVTVGLVNRSQVHPREVFADAVSDRACALIVAHNHPSGNLTPSQEDRRVTRVLVDAGRLLGISLLDHLIFSGTGYWSFQEHGSLLGL